jgi:hypothetical protein
MKDMTGMCVFLGGGRDDDAPAKGKAFFASCVRYSANIRQTAFSSEA